MQGSAGGAGAASSSDPEMTIFAGVRFVLFGFDSVSETQYRLEIVRRGGTDVGKYNQSCTHVIVSGRTYDDPVCVAAREDMKTLVTEMWIDDSVDFGVLADATRILYKPVRDFNGIPGSESLHICLTGYQRQEREDIMKMVSLMGAKFSKPLIANQVTHLICYKFEGEKYDLAKKVNIKLVNHRWLEDCLKEWEILPTDNYTKSGWEVNILEAEARDSEEESVEAGIRTSRQRSSVGTSIIGNGKSDPAISDLITPLTGKNTVQNNITVAKQSSVADHHIISGTLLTAPGKGSSSEKELHGCNFVREEVFQTSGDPKICTMDDGKSFIQCKSNIMESDKTSSTKFSSISSLVGKKLNSPSYLKKSEKKLVSPVLSANFKSSPRGPLKENMSKIDFDISLFAPREDETYHEPANDQNLNTNVNLYLEDASGSLPQKRKISPSRVGIKSPKMECQSFKASTLSSPQESMKVQEIEFSTILPHEGDSLTLGEAVQTVQVVGLSDLTEKMQVDQLKLKLHHEKSASEKLHHKICQKASTENEASNAVFSSSDRSKPLKLGTSPLSLDDDLLAGDMHKIMKSTVCDFGSLAISEGLVTFSGSAGQNLTTKDDGETANGEALNVVNEGPSIRYTTQKQEKVLSNIGDDEKQKTLFTASKMLKENQEAVPATWTKKAVAKKSKDGRAKLNRASNLEGNVADSDKTVTTIEPAVENGMFENMKAKAVNDETRKNLMEEKGKLLPEDIIMEDITHTEKTAAKKSTIRRKKLSTASSKEASISETVTTSEPAGKSGKFRDMNAKPASDETKRKLMDKQGEILPEDVIMEDIRPTKKTVAKKSRSSRTKSSTVCCKGHVTDSDKAFITYNDAAAESVRLRNMKAKTVLDKTSKRLTEEQGEDRTEKADRLVPVGMHKDATSNDKDSGKENFPDDNGLISDRTTTHNEKINMHDRQSLQIPNNRKMEEMKNGKFSRLEPACFILSGNQIQRKEFQMVIRRLRGRICRASHQWSYQATHFVAPHPVRRTEKFFAAAAAGRWILKPDYLTTSNEAGKFLDEEPFEVYSKGLTEDGTISLEAPRKWRLLRERTGHGAFYGMRIIIYGECIAPTLDTLKRAVKAGDGTILATSPPYTRFLESGVDYAVVSPSMPRVDSWVQEFLRHNISCVASDYLVEYVCKTGYSLEKHVLHKTHCWAEKSFANLLSRSEEVIEDAALVSEGSSDELTCTVCGQRDREEVMLICGNEAGSVGCGIGTHIDCCDPPLEGVPEGDWLCPRCTGVSSERPLRGQKQLKLSSRRRR